MRVEIKTKGKVKDKEIRAVYILNEGLKQSSDRMRVANLNFVLGKYGLTVTPKSDRLRRRK